MIRLIFPPLPQMDATLRQVLLLSRDVYLPREKLFVSVINRIAQQSMKSFRMNHAIKVQWGRCKCRQCQCGNISGWSDLRSTIVSWSCARAALSHLMLLLQQQQVKSAVIGCNDFTCSDTLNIPSVIAVHNRAFSDIFHGYPMHWRYWICHCVHCREILMMTNLMTFLMRLFIMILNLHIYYSSCSQINRRRGQCSKRFKMTRGNTGMIILEPGLINEKHTNVFLCAMTKPFWVLAFHPMLCSIYWHILSI